MRTIAMINWTSQKHWNVWNGKRMNVQREKKKTTIIGCRLRAHRKCRTRLLLWWPPPSDHFHTWQQSSKLIWMIQHKIVECRIDDKWWSNFASFTSIRSAQNTSTNVETHTMMGDLSNTHSSNSVLCTARKQKKNNVRNENEPKWIHKYKWISSEKLNMHYWKILNCPLKKKPESKLMKSYREKWRLHLYIGTISSAYRVQANLNLWNWLNKNKLD